MPPDLAVPVAQGLERTHLGALILDHAGERGEHHHGSHQISQYREHQRQVLENIHVCPGPLGAGMGLLGQEQRRGQQSRQIALHLGPVRTGCQEMCIRDSC